MRTTENLFKATAKSPGHFSVGVVLINNEGLVAMHHWEHAPWADNLHLFMRETLLDHEPLEGAVARGLQEEWGASGKIVAFLGALCKEFDMPSEGRFLRKTTAYFLVKLESIDLAKRSKHDIESDSKVVWLTLAEAEKTQHEQGKRFPERPDLNEADVCKWVIEYNKS